MSTALAKQSIRPPLDAAIKAQVLDRLNADPTLSHRQLANELSISPAVVDSIAKRLHGEPDLSDKRMRTLVRQIGKRLSMADRAMIYETLARGTCNPKAGFVQKAALQRIEELEGIVTKKEQKESADNQAPTLPVMFQLPDNTSIDIGIRIKRGK